MATALTIHLLVHKNERLGKYGFETLFGKEPELPNGTVEVCRIERSTEIRTIDFFTEAWKEATKHGVKPSDLDMPCAPTQE
ncbi:hypothetical protein C0581_01700 [Candidatus Parcubacteria bacterium]|nr:MAG: hypothetical protein C0581_01700 [Candidatus Parcubacteria bacterium]